MQSEFRVVAEERDLDAEPISLSDGTVLDEAAATAYGGEVADRAAARRGGRPSLTAPGVHSPKLSARVNPELRASVDALADRDGVAASDIVRRALEEYVAAHAE